MAASTALPGAHSDVTGNDVKDATVTVMMRKWVRLVLGVGFVAVAVAAFTVVQQPMPTSIATTGSAPERPMPSVEEPAPAAAASETAVLAGGCFWGVQGLFQHVNGVRAAESGYAGGDRQTANYEAVSRGDTGHVESVRIAYDPTQVTYAQLLRIFFTAVEKPDQVTREAPGPQYRTTIFAQDDTQKRIAESYIAELNRTAAFPSPIITTVSPRTEFFPAERYHQDFMYSNPTEPYIASSEMPKLPGLKRLFPDQYREQPVLLLG